jgi:hypothetical protein
LGMKFENGEKVSRDYDEAIRWYRLAADLGIIEAQGKLDSLLNKMQKHLIENPLGSKEFKGSKETPDTQTTIAPLSPERNQVKREIAKATEVNTQPNINLKEEQFGSISNSVSALTKKAQIGKGIKNSEVIISKDFISKYLGKWVRAWENKDIELYLSLYSDVFKGLEETNKDWRISRQAKFEKNKNISIQLENIHFFSTTDTVEINFIQTFKSDRYADIGLKKLVWMKSGSQWRIIRETWAPKQNIH